MSSCNLQLASGKFPVNVLIFQRDGDEAKQKEGQYKDENTMSSDPLPHIQSAKKYIKMRNLSCSFCIQFFILVCFLVFHLDLCKPKPVTFHRGGTCFQATYCFKLYAYLEFFLIRYSERQRFLKRPEIDVFLTTEKSNEIVCVFLCEKLVF